MKPALVYAQPLDKVANARTGVWVGDAPNADGFGLGGFVWEPALGTRPILSMEFMSPDMDGKIQVAQAHFSILLGQLQNAGDVTRLYWQGAPVQLWTAADLSYNRAIAEFTGTITNARLDVDGNVLTVDAAASTALIERPILTGEFTGAGGLLGETALRGTLWPAGFGIVPGIEPVWFDTTYNIGMIDGYGNTLSIDRLLEGASVRGARIADYADYNALKTAIVNKVISPGQWGTCVAQGLVGLGAPPVGVVQVDATFGGGKPGSLMRRLLEIHAAIPLAQIDTAAFDALTAQIETLLGHAAPVHYWLNSQRQVNELLETIAASCNATPIITTAGLVSVTRCVLSASSVTLDRSGSIDPRVIDWARADSPAPFFKLKARTARPAKVLTRDQVNFADTIVPQGVYNVLTIYRAGNTVFKPDGSEWLYTNAAALAGQALPATALSPAAMASNASWQQVGYPTSYADGTSIDALRPQEVGANKTETRTAAALANQGALATLNNAALGATGTVVQQDGVTHVTDATAITSQGTASGIANQGVLATKNTAALGTSGQVVQSDGTTKVTDATAITSLGTAAAVAGQGTLATANYSYYGTGGTIKEALGGADATLANFKTSSGTAAGIASQGALATLSQVSWGSSGRVYRDDGVTRVTDASSITGLGTAAGIASQGSYATLSQTYFGDGLLKETSGGTTATLANFKTSSGTAAGIASQGALATRNNVRLATEVYRSDGVTVATEAMLVTSLGTASAFSGQGALATLGYVTAGSNIRAADGTTVLGDNDLRNLAAPYAVRLGATAPIVYEFDSGTSGFAANNANLAAASGVLTITATAADPQLLVGVGSALTDRPKIRIRCRSKSVGAIWDGTVFWTNGGHGYSGAYFKSIPPPPGWYAGDWCIAEWDFNSVSGTSSNPGDFLNPGVTTLRVDLASVQTNVDVDWLALGDFVGLPVPINGIEDRATRGGTFNSNVFRNDGTTVVTDSLAITGLGTAAGIASQGSYATLSQTYFGDGLLKETSGGTTATLANFKTSSGTAAGIASQGALATLSNVAWGSSGRVFRDDGVTRVTDASSITTLGTAAAIAGQGTGATANNLAGLNATEGAKFGAMAPNADAAVKLSALGPTSVARQGNTLTNTSGGDSFGASLVSPAIPGGAATASMDIVAGANWTLAALDTSNTTYDYSTQLVYAGYRASDGQLSVWSSNVNLVNSFIAANLTGRFEVRCNRVNAEVWVAGVNRATFALSPAGPLYAKFYAYTAASTTTGFLYGPFDDLSRQQKLAATGVATDSSILPANTLYGLIPSLKAAVTISDTDNTGTVTINIGNAVFYPDSGGTVTFPSGTVAGKAYNTVYYIKRTGVDPVSATTGTGWNASTTLTIAVGDVYVNFFTTRATGGSAPPPPPPPPGGGSVGGGGGYVFIP